MSGGCSFNNEREAGQYAGAIDKEIDRINGMNREELRKMLISLNVDVTKLRSANMLNIYKASMINSLSLYKVQAMGYIAGNNTGLSLPHRLDLKKT